MTARLTTTPIAARVFNGRAWIIDRFGSPLAGHYRIYDERIRTLDYPARAPDGSIYLERPDRIPDDVRAWIASVI